MNEQLKQMMADLAEPFPEAQVGWKPRGKPYGNRVAVAAYIDARDVQERLDEVVGPFGWQADYVWHEHGVVECRLSLCNPAGQWITKVDVGGESDQPDASDKAKAAVSDALKRAAVHWGIGRYLYRLDGQWADFDPEKKRITKTPALPDWAKPRARVKAEPRDLQALTAALVILAPAVAEGQDAFLKAAATLSPAMKKAVGKADYDVYLCMAESVSASKAPKTNGKHPSTPAAK